MEEIVNSLIETVKKSDKVSIKIKKIFENAIKNTFTTTIKITDRDDAFVVTGDIPAMWLRDSAGQIRPLFYINSKESDELILKVLKRQWFSITKDTYANAFNEIDNGKEWNKFDETLHSPWVWERKYELDSLCYIMQTAHLYYEKTKDGSFLTDEFIETLEKIVDQIILEMHHENSEYEFLRPEAWAPSDTLRSGKRGTKVGYTGLSWTGFRPSDDSCIYQYLIPANAFAVVSLRRLANVLETEGKSKSLIEKMRDTSNVIEEGIKKFGSMDTKSQKDIYAYEVDGLENQLFMDDANVPNLLSLPYLEYVRCDDEKYLRTRKAILSKENPYFFEGKVAKGIGSEHTPKDYIWHIGLAIELMTTDDQSERDRIIKHFEDTDANTLLMHEGFHKDDASIFTRSWFSWANSMFCEAILRYIGVDMVKR